MKKCIHSLALVARPKLMTSSCGKSKLMQSKKILTGCVQGKLTLPTSTIQPNKPSPRYSVGVQFEN